MIGHIWFSMIAIAVLTGILNGTLTEVVSAIPTSATSSFRIAIGLGGIMTLWLGIMRIAEDAGMIKWLSHVAQPVIHKIFPHIPKDHPAIGAIALSMAANLLGLNNAATPLGIKAMEKLEEINPTPEIASNSMCTFLAINTSSIQLIPTTAIGILATAGSVDPTRIITTSLLATSVSTFVAITISLAFARINGDKS